MRTVQNIDGIVKTFQTDSEFLKYVQTIYKENEDGQPYPSELHWLPENIQQATEYIVEYCPDLLLVEDAPLKTALDNATGLDWQDDGDGCFSFEPGKAKK